MTSTLQEMSGRTIFLIESNVCLSPFPPLFVRSTGRGYSGHPVSTGCVFCRGRSIVVRPPRLGPFMPGGRY